MIKSIFNGKELPTAEQLKTALKDTSHFYETLGIGGMTTRGIWKTSDKNRWLKLIIIKAKGGDIVEQSLNYEQLESVICKLGSAIAEKISPNEKNGNR